MKVLFIFSGGSCLGISPIIKSQAESLIRIGVQIEFYPIKGKGFKGYLSNLIPLRRNLKANKYDIIHAHYGLSAITATLAGAKPLMVSLMGSDIMEGGWQLMLIRLFVRKRWVLTIAKTHELAKIVGEKFTIVIPNGVNLKKFKPISKVVAREYIGYPENKKMISFIANPERYEKNYSLAVESVKTLYRDDVVLLPVFNKPDTDIIYYMNAADVILLTSIWEGSVNVIKEAMACNCPIVATDVGDIKWVIGDTGGCFISSFDPADVADKIKIALAFGKRTKGRNRILELGLDSETGAKKIIEVYKRVLNR